MIGWQGLKDVSFWGLGTRLVGHINVPDLELIPERYHPELVDGLEFRAGLECDPCNFPSFSSPSSCRFFHWNDLQVSSQHCPNY